MQQSTNPEFNRAVIRVNVHKGFSPAAGSGGTSLSAVSGSEELFVASALARRQTVQYVDPADVARNGPALLQLAELVCIDEAAAIPLPVVKLFLGPFLLFISSTVNGFAPFSFLAFTMIKIWGKFKTIKPSRMEVTQHTHPPTLPLPRPTH